jgi:hypothetical protein
MANDARRISDLAIANTLSANDRVVILANPDTSANVKTITANNFAASLIASNVIPVASTTQLGVVKVDGNTITISNGTISATANNYNQQLNTTSNVTFNSVTTSNISSQNDVNINLGNNAYTWTYLANGQLEASGDIIPGANNVYHLGNSSMRWNALWVGGNSVIFADQNPVYPDQILTVGNGVFYIAQLSNTQQESNAGLQVGNFLLQNNTISLLNTSSTFYIGATLATGNLVINRPVVVNSPDTGKQTFGVLRNGRIQILTPNTIPAGDVGAVNIIGSSDGSYQNVTNPGGMLHITGNDGTSTRVTLDAFGANAIPVVVGRAARGTANTPSNTQVNDTLLRLSAVGWAGSDNFASSSNVSPTTIEAQALENFTNSAIGTQWNIYNAPQGNITKTLVASFNTAGLKLRAANSGITFTDNTVQNTAFNSTSAVTGLNVGTGLTSSGNTGNVSISATGVQSIAGTNNQVIVNNVGQNITLSLPQSIATNSTVSFGSLTVNNFTVTGTSTIANSTYITNKVFNLAYNSNSSSQIDQGGFTLGNTSAAYSVSFLYSLANNAWNTDGAGLITTNFTASQNSYFTDIFVSNGANFGAAYAGYDYPNAIVQIDGNINSYLQTIQQNHSNGINASSDFVAVNDLGTDGTYFVDMGINSSTYNGTGVGWTISGPNDAYLYNANGDLTIGTSTAGNILKFHTGGTYANNIRATISDSGLNVTGNVTATYFLGNLIGNANTANYIGTLAAANVVSTTQLSGNLAAYQTTSGLSANVATLASNSAFYIPANTGIVSNSSGVFANTSYIDSRITAAGLQTTAGLAANVATLTANNTSFVGTVSAANVVSNTQLQSNLANYVLTTYLTSTLSVYQTSAGLSSNVVTLTSNSANYIGSIPAASVATTSQLSGYQTTAGLAANVATLTSNNVSFVGTVSAANVVSNTQLQSNLASYVTATTLTNTLTNYQTTAGLSANVLILTANAAGYLSNSSGTLSNIASWISGNAAIAYSNAVANAAALYQTTSGLSANVLTLTANAAGFLGNSSGTLANVSLWVTGNAAAAYSNAVANAAALYQTTAGLSANVLTLSSNNTSYLGGVAAASYVNTSGSYTLSGVYTHNANIVLSAGLSANGSYGTNGQYLASNGTSVYWANQYPEMLIYSIDADRSLLTQNTAQSLFGVGVTLATNTKYRYKIYGTVYKSNTSGPSTGAMQFAITNSTANAVLGRSYYISNPCAANTSQPTVMPAYQVSQSVNTGFSTLYTITNSNTGATWYSFVIDGTLDVTTGGTLNPQIGFTHSNGTLGSATVLQSGATFEIWPIGNATSNSVIGTWA